jgi:hypothetical protein
METVVKDTHFFINMEIGQTFSIIQCFLLGIDSYKFWIVSSGILYRSSRRTSSSYSSTDFRRLRLTICARSATVTHIVVICS